MWNVRRPIEVCRIRGNFTDTCSQIGISAIDVGKISRGEWGDIPVLENHSNFWLFWIGSTHLLPFHKKLSTPLHHPMVERWPIQEEADGLLGITYFLEDTPPLIYVHPSRSSHVFFDCILSLRHSKPRPVCSNVVFLPSSHIVLSSIMAINAVCTPEPRKLSSICLCLIIAQTATIKPRMRVRLRAMLYRKQR